MLRNLSFSFFASFLIILLKSFMKKLHSSIISQIYHLTKSFLSWIAKLSPKYVLILTSFLYAHTSAADAVTFNSNGTKTLLANVLSTLAVKGQAGFSNVPRSISRNPPNCTILDSWGFEIFIFAEELFAKAIRNLETCVLVNYNLYGKLGSS